MADVILTYKGDTIAELSESGNKTINTAGKYCEADILLEYVKSGGGNATFVNLNDSDMWERKDVSSSSAVGTSYEDCKTASTTRITTKELVPFDSFEALKISNGYTVYMLLFDENKKYISYRGGWFNSQILTSSNFSKVTGSKLFSDAKFVSMSMKKETSNAEITPSEVESLIVQYISGG